MVLSGRFTDMGFLFIWMFKSDGVLTARKCPLDPVSAIPVGVILLGARGPISDKGVKLSLLLTLLSERGSCLSYS